MVRPREPLALAIDMGTSSLRALAYDQALEPVPGLEVHLPHEPRLTGDGGAELNARLLARRTVSAVDEVLRRAGHAEFAAVGISSFWHGLVAVDGALRPLTPALLWSDRRPWREAARLRSELDERMVHRRTGCRLHTSYWPAKIAWLRRTRGWRRSLVSRWLSPVDLLLAELFGEIATSSSLASGTGLFGLRRPGWDAALLGAVGISADALPAVRDELPALLPRWRRRWPALAGARWAPVLGDGAAASLGSGCAAPDRRALTIGTSSALRVTTSEPPRRLPASLWCYRADPGRFVVGGALSAGGNHYEWLERVLRIDPAAGRRAATAAPLTFLPLLAGERSPGFALDATGAITGLTLATSADDILAAGLEAIAIQLALVDRELDRLFPQPRVVVASGEGLLQDRAWRRVICDALGKPLAPSKAREASSRGAALAALGVDPAAADPGLDRPLRPSTSPAVRQHYRAALARYAALYRVLIGGSDPRRRRSAEE